MNNGREQKNDTYVISGRTLSGSPEEMLAQLDDAVAALLAFRQLLVVQLARRGPTHLQQQ